MDNNTLFSTLTSDKEILKALERLNFTDATPVQAKAIPAMLEGRDVTVQAPTGSGKTAAFSIPILEGVDLKEKTIQALILSPTRELSLQTTEVLVSLSRFKPGIKITTIYGGDPIEKQFALLRKKPQIVVATPGRLIDHINRKTIKLDSVKVFVLDEADRMLDMGFRPDINHILKYLESHRQTALFSATISKEIREIAEKYQKDTVYIEIAQAAKTVESVEQFFTLVNLGQKISEMMELLVEKHPKRTIIFANTKRMTEKISNELKDEGYNSNYLHGDMRQGQRTRVMNLFKKGKLDVLVATDVAARGIDVSDIDMVINYDLPKEEDSYIHRIGRTGRADKLGVAHTFIYSSELRELEQVIISTGAVIKEYAALAEENQEVKPAKSVEKKKRGRSSSRRERPTPSGKKEASGYSPFKKKPQKGGSPNFNKRKPSLKKKTGPKPDGQ